MLPAGEGEDVNMLSMQHIMVSMLNGHSTAEHEYIAAVVFPDAIRAFTGNRELSHFEENDFSDDKSNISPHESMHKRKEVVNNE